MAENKKCTLITTVHDESFIIKALSESQCNDAVVFYQHTHDEIPKSYHWNVNYIKITDTYIDAIKQIRATLNNYNSLKFYLGNPYLDMYVLYEILCEKKFHEIWILESNQFKRLPQKEAFKGKRGIILNKICKYEPVKIKIEEKKDKGKIVTFAFFEYKVKDEKGNYMDESCKAGLGITKSTLYGYIKKFGNYGLIEKDKNLYKLTELGKKFMDIFDQVGNNEDYRV